MEFRRFRRERGAFAADVFAPQGGTVEIVSGGEKRVYSVADFGAKSR